MTDLELLTPNEIIRTRRKSISLIIKNNGEFIVRAPIKATDKRIRDFINLKSKWIISKRKEQLNNVVKPITFSDLEQIMLLDKPYNLVYSDVVLPKLGSEYIILPKEKSKEKLILLLKKIAKKHIQERVRLISELFGFKYNKISITSAKSCWGSCSSNNNLHFTYRLIMCPEDLIDYIVLHELCHTKIKNHSKLFWALVEQCNPYYKTHEKWLKVNRAIMEII